ncbi:Dolichol phosphate-mannose biosynthesis regulatory protein [Plasmodiophora brassicae]
MDPHVVEQPRVSRMRVVLCGYLLLLLALVVWTVVIYAVVVSKFMPVMNHSALDWLRDDHYYSLLVPLCAPVLASTVYVNWLGLKLFRHS